MNNRQAIKIAIKYLQKSRQDHAYDANLFRRELAIGIYFQNEDEKVQKIDEAIKTLEQLDNDLKVLKGWFKLPSAPPPEWKQLELFK